MALAPFIIIGFIALIIFGAVFGGAKKRQRAASMQQWAASLGLSFEPQKQHGFDRRFAEFGCFRQGKNRYAHNVAAGDYEGRPVTAFDYHYETESTRTVTDTDARGSRTTRTETVTHNHDFSAVILEPAVPLKSMLIRPEGLGDRIANFFGKNDIDFESAEFSKRFHVSADDRRWAYDVLHARTLEHLLSYPKHTIEFTPRRVLVLRGRRRMDSEQFHTALKIVDGVLDRLPDYLRRQQMEVPA